MIATMTPEVRDPKTGRVLRKARVSVPRVYSPPTRLNFAGRTVKVVGATGGN